MAYSQDLKNSARRHLNAAQTLHAQTAAGLQPGAAAVAGYLYGLAGELAVKEMMRRSGMIGDSHEDASFAHFPRLKTLLRTATGRRSGELCKIANNERLFQYWDISMRYAHTAEIKPEWVDSWGYDANGLVDRMNAE